MSLAKRQELVKNLGFTLFELLIVVTIAAILMAIAIPSFMATIRSNRLTAYANELVTSLNLARSEAVKRSVPVTVRRVDDSSSTNLGAGANWEDGWDIFVDQNGNGVFEDDGDASFCETGEDCLLKSYPGLKIPYTLRGNVNFTAAITYLSSGRSNLDGIFVVCDDSDGMATPSANTSRLILINQVGRVGMGVDTDNDQIPENGGVNLTTCTP